MRRKAGIFAVAVFAATALLAALAGTAAAGGIASSYFTDPQNTNVPYLAWDGEQIRLVKCFTAAELPVVGVGRFVIEDWSGNPFFKPQFENSGVNGTDGTAVEFAGAGDQAGNFCYATDIVSLKPGLAVVKLVVENRATPNQGVPLAKHQFLAVWMDLGDMNTFELNTPIAGDFSSTGTATNLFDPLVSTANGYVDVRIKGTFPLGNNFAGMAPSDTVTLPDDWVWLAEHFAVEQASTSARPGQAAYRWDIHDSLSWDPSQALDGPANHSTAERLPGSQPDVPPPEHPVAAAVRHRRQLPRRQRVRVVLEHLGRLDPSDDRPVRPGAAGADAALGRPAEHRRRADAGGPDRCEPDGERRCARVG